MSDYHDRRLPVCGHLALLNRGSLVSAIFRGLLRGRAVLRYNLFKSLAKFVFGDYLHAFFFQFLHKVGHCPTPFTRKSSSPFASFQSSATTFNPTPVRLSKSR